MMIPIACTIVHNFIMMDTTNLAEDDDIGDEMMVMPCQARRPM